MRYLTILLVVAMLTSARVDTLAPPDTDGDRIPDQWEKANGLDALDPSDACDDPDGDGYSNWEEFVFRSDPQDKTDHPPPSIKLRFVKFTGEDPPTATVRSVLDEKEFTVTNGTTFVYQQNPFLVEFKEHITPGYPRWRDVGLIDMAGTHSAKRNNHWQIGLFRIEKTRDAEPSPRPYPGKAADGLMGNGKE